MRERQMRCDEETAKAVARGVNILGVRGSVVAKRYMEHKRVPADVIARVVNDPARRRQQSAEQATSEAITPSKPGPTQ
ncbi:MAG: hypothetical protein ACXWC4_00235 [Telluria sp.]